MRSKFLFLLAGSSVVALAGSAAAQTAAPVEQIVVTGSRVIANGNAAPTPVTVVTMERLQQSSPLGLSRGLVELPQFAASDPSRGQNQADRNSAGAYLNLRQFGAQRNLILMDGIRVAPTTADGRTDIAVMPQGLIQRVDIVTGGVSAVYGSDAVTGVINFVIDHNFNGVKGFAQYGISTFGDGESWRAGATAGGEIAPGLHVEATVEGFHQVAVHDDGHRGLVAGFPNMWTFGGAGTAAAPTVLVRNSRSYSTGAPGGVIKQLGSGTCPSATCQTDITFKQNGVPTPFIHGTTVPGSAGLESGGDGAYFDGMDMLSRMTTYQSMARADYDVTDNVKAYLQGSFAQSQTNYPWQAQTLQNKTIFSGNAFIPSSIQTFMTANKITQFTISKLPTADQGYPSFHPYIYSYSQWIRTGLNGGLWGWNWKADYAFSHDLEHVVNGNNLNQEKFAAALDAVVNPANGQVVCNVTLTTTRYSNCVAFNMFGPTAASLAAFHFIDDNTEYRLFNTLHDVNLSISGPLFALPAGDVVAAVSGEYRHQSLKNISNANPGAAPDCTGIRGNCTTTIWFNSTTAPLFASLDVEEAAVEFEVPVFKNESFADALDLNLAARYTNYSTSGAAWTWKVGGTWDLNDQLRFRATRSLDIRAPTLFDLYRPVSTSVGGFIDPHTGIQGPLVGFSQGNPNLTPEIGNTYTGGVVYKPDWLPGFNIAVDAYKIALTDAITTVNGTNATAIALCESSGGTSPFCANLARPLPFSDRSPSNFPLRSFNQNLNVTKQTTYGLDIEASYTSGLDTFFAGAPGDINMRMITNFQPHLTTVTFPGQPATETAGVASNSAFNAGFSRWRINYTLGYGLDDLNVTTIFRWQSEQHRTDPRLFVDARADIPAFLYIDLNLSYKIDWEDHLLSPYVTIKNLTNLEPPIIGQNGSFPGALYPVSAGYDVMGRYFTFGVRATL